MNTEDCRDLSRRIAATLAAHPQFRWAPGMVWRRTSAGGQGLSLQSSRLTEADVDQVPGTGFVPDLADAATAGVLLSWVPGLRSVQRRDLETGPDWSVRYAVPRPDDEDRTWTTFPHPTLGEAAATALLAIWGPVGDEVP